MDNPLSRLIHGVVLVLFMVLLLPIAVLVFIATGALMAGLGWLLGSPTGTVASVMGLVWFGGSLALVFLICVLAYRRISLIRRITHVEDQIPGPSADDPATRARDPHADPATLYSRVAAADARLAEPPSERSSRGASESA